MSPWSMALRIALAQGALQIALLLLARALGRRLRWEIVTLGLVLPWLVLAPWISGEIVLAPTGALAGQVPGTAPRASVDEHAAEQNDSMFQFLPWEFEVRRAFDAGRLPWWSESLDGGSSPWANPMAAVLSPTALLGRVAPIRAHTLAVLLLAITIAAEGAWVLARLAGARRGGALVAAVSAALGGGVMAWGLFAHAVVAAWIPWHAAGVLRLFRRPSARATVVAALLTAVLLLAGQPEVALGGGVFAAALGLAWRRRALPLRRSLAAAVLAAALGFGLAAPMVLPFLHVMPKSWRASEHLSPPAVAPLEWSRPWSWFTAGKQRLALAAWNPHAFGRPFAEKFRGPIAWTLASTPYAGLVALVCAVTAFAAGNRRARWLLAVVVGIWVLASGFLPLERVLHLVPPLRLPDYGRFLAVGALALALAGGLGADLWLRGRVPFRAGAALALAGLLSLRLQADAAVLAIWGLIAAAWLASLWRARTGAWWARAAVLVLLLAALARDLVPWSRDLLPRGDPELFFPATDEVAALARVSAEAGSGRATGQDLLVYPGLLPAYGMAEIRPHNALSRADVLANLGAAFGFAPTNQSYFASLGNLDHPLLDFLNVRAVFSNRYLPVAVGLEPAVELGDLWLIYRNPEALPRHFLATGVDLLPRSGIAPWIATMDDARRVAVFADEAAGLQLEDREWDSGAVQVQAFAEGEVRLRVRTGGSDALLATSLANPEGWRALAAPDGAPLRTLTVNGAYFGALVPGAVNEVTLRYRPPGLRGGIALAALALGGLAVLAWSGRRGSRPAPARTVAR